MSWPGARSFAGVARSEAASPRLAMATPVEAELRDLPVHAARSLTGRGKWVEVVQD